jgi:hypothetical protein
MRQTGLHSWQPGVATRSALPSAGKATAAAVGRLGDSPLPIAGQHAQRTSRPNARGGGQPACRAVLGQRGQRAIRDTLLHATRDIRRGGRDRAVDGDRLLHPLAFPVVEEAVGGHRARRLILPARELALVIVGERGTRWCSGTCGAPGWRVAGHVPPRRRSSPYSW